MTLDEAIIILTHMSKSTNVASLEKCVEAIKLGIEALKCLKEQRSGTVLDEYDFLPGETKD